jgi:signal peptidase I
VRNPLGRLTASLPAPLRVGVDWAVTIAVAILFILVFEAEVAKPYRIPSASMEPTLRCSRPAAGCTAHFSDRVIALRLAYRLRAPHRGEVVVFKAPDAAANACGESDGSVFVKRIVGLPGELVSERDGYVAINGHRLDEPYVPAHERDSDTTIWPRLKQGQYFVMGDNRLNSCDSRMWGPVSRKNLIGPVVLTYWPPNRIDVN